MPQVQDVVQIQLESKLQVDLQESRLLWYLQQRAASWPSPTKKPERQIVQASCFTNFKHTFTGFLTLLDRDAG